MLYTGLCLANVEAHEQCKRWPYAMLAFQKHSDVIDFVQLVIIDDDV